MLGATLNCMDTPARLDISVIAKRLVARRTALRLEQTEVAERAGLSRAYVSRLEKCLVPNPKLLDLDSVAQVLGFSLAELIAPDMTLTETRYSTEFAELQRQIANLPEDQQARIVAGYWQSVEIAYGAALARRN